MIYTILFMLAAGALFYLSICKRHCVFPAFLFLDTGPEDDSDMKIAGAAPAPENTEDTQTELVRERENGNLDKARSLSIRLSLIITEKDKDPDFGYNPDESPDMRTQRRILLTFTVTNTIEHGISSRLLGKVIINGFFNRLSSNSPDFYADICESASFSFYTLCTRKEGSLSSCIGKTFAMLTGKTGDKAAEGYGESLFFRFRGIIDDAVADCGFIQ